MFTGRISECGVITESRGDVLRIRVAKAANALKPGDSVCVHGVRLTASEVGDGEFQVTLTEETRRRSTYDEAAEGTSVNVELPLTVGDSLDGHLVQGYVDAVGKVTRIDEEGPCRRVWIRPPERIIAQLISKSAIAIDGVSVTVAEVVRDRFCFVLLPVTSESTSLGRLAVGSRVNLESDLVARIAAHGSAGAGTELGHIVAGLPWAGAVSGRSGVDKVVRQLAAGGGVIVWDPLTEGEGDVIFAGATLKPESFAFLLTKVCGLPAVPCAPEVLDRLQINKIPGDGDKQGTAFCVPVDLADCTGTGVSAAERAATVRRLANPSSAPADFTRPGHVVPLRADAGGLAKRKGHTEATVDLCVAAGLPPVGVCCEVMNPDGTMAGAAELETFALRWGMPMIHIADLDTWSGLASKERQNQPMRRDSDQLRR